MDSYSYLGKILGVSADMLRDLDASMAAQTGRQGVMAHIAEENESHIRETLGLLELGETTPPHIREALRRVVLVHESQLLEFVRSLPGETEFDKAAAFARQASNVRKGFFLKRDYAEKIFRARPPANLLSFLGLASVDELFARHDVLEAFSALRFMETDEWMHETFEVAYSSFTPSDFEERDIEIKVLGAEWEEVAKKFVAKKHHNVSHLKEFGVIFINPIKEDVPGKFLRDTALLLHYVHEIEFYSKLFVKYSAESGFAERLKALLRGDVKESVDPKKNEWLIVQRYLFKENPNDPRLFLPRVNPESMHWRRGERDLALFKDGGDALNLKLWNDLDWVGSYFQDDPSFVSFDLEDNAMTAVSFNEGKNEVLTYHQREALWTKIFEEYVGGEEIMEQLLIENFDKGQIRF